MTEKEYDDELKKLEDEFLNKKRKLAILFVDSNRKYEIGDIISDRHSNKIKIKRVYPSLSFGSKYPEAKYCGRVLKKDGTPTKIEKYEYISQRDIKEGFL